MLFNVINEFIDVIIKEINIAVTILITCKTQHIEVIARIIYYGVMNHLSILYVDNSLLKIFYADYNRFLAITSIHFIDFYLYKDKI